MNLPVTVGLRFPIAFVSFNLMKGQYMKNVLKYSVMGLVLALGSSVAAHAHHHQDPPPAPAAPEVDPSLAIGGFTLLAGTIAVARARRRS